jgi:AAA+ superfamily predicted ATPase
MNDLHDLELIIQSATPIIYIESPEESRIDHLAGRLSIRLGKSIARWSVVRGLDSGGQVSSQDGEADPTHALQQILAQKKAGIFLFFDLHPWLDEPVVVRLLREIGKQYEQVAHTLLLVSPSVEIPPELQSLAVKFTPSLPDKEDIKQMILTESEKWGQKKKNRVQAKQEVVDAIIRNLIGLSFSESRSIIRTLIYDDGILDDQDVDRAIQAKYKALDSNGVLSFEMDTARFTDVAGLRRMKEWLSYRKEVFLADNAPAGLDTPKGLLLLGVQGSGKSLAAKAVAGAWQVPLLRLDFGALYNKYFGETEKNLRQSLKTAEVMAPTVLWIDEIEKGLSADGDGGPSKRVLGTLLTWMAERQSRVFLVATANDIEALPPELLRKGRFDEIFFVDLPVEDVRREIFRIHLARREQDPTRFDLDGLAEAADGFSGAEIEQAVVASVYASYARKEELSTEHVLAELAKTKPLSILMAEKISYLRSWAAARTVPAD